MAGRPWDGGDMDRAVDGSMPASPPLPVADDAQEDQRQHYCSYGAHPGHADALARGLLYFAWNRIEEGCKVRRRNVRWKGRSSTDCFIPWNSIFKNRYCRENTELRRFEKLLVDEERKRVK